VETYRKFPHQLSGGQQQRVIIAMALACDPELVVLDEPTTGLDVTTQAQILALLMELRARAGLALLYITHNLGVVAQLCDHIGVMYAGRLVEVATREALFSRPKHPYTQGLIASVPRLSAPAGQPTVLLPGLLERGRLPPGCCFAPRCEFARPRCWQEPQPLAPVDAAHTVACWRWPELPALTERVDHQAEQPASVQPASSDRAPILQVNDLRAGYAQAGQPFFRRAAGQLVLDGVSFALAAGQTFALVGESGSGKSTMVKALNGFLPNTTGVLRFNTAGVAGDLTLPIGQRPTSLRRAIQLIFQNPDASLNPRQRVADIVGRPLQKFFGLTGRAQRQRAEQLLRAVSLAANYLERFPDELSGGERQRIAIARALAAEPSLLLCDEIVSALDVSVQASILRLLVDLQAQHHLACLFISHDLAVVRSLAHRVGVLYRGFLCEVGDVAAVFNPPYHPYTYLLLSAVPEPDPARRLPVPAQYSGPQSSPPHKGCPFAARCPWKVGPICDEVPPPWQATSASHGLRCHIPLEQLRTLQPPLATEPA
jgi:peptide/nickel transport system ATP-binding protein